MDKKERIFQKLKDFSFFRISVIADLEIDNQIYRDVEQINNDSVITPENWDEKKDIFFEQRMEKYKESYTIEQKINFEFDEIKLLPLMNKDFKVLADNYKRLLDKKNKNTKLPKKTSYVWHSNPDKELPELYSLMIDKYKLIASETTYEQFKAVFTGQPIDVICEIERTKKFTNVLLTYFVSKLFQRNNPNDYISIAERCFVNAKNLSQAQTNYFNNQNNLPKNHNLIDSLLKDLQNPL
jgi:hypothetical protein